MGWTIYLYLLLNILLIISILIQDKSKQTVDFNSQNSKNLLKFNGIEISTMILIISLLFILSIQYIKSL